MNENEISIVTQTTLPIGWINKALVKYEENYFVLS